MIEYKKINILNATEKYIIHQCNCITKKAAGLALAIFTKWPYANIYRERTACSIPSFIDIRGNGLGNRYIINLMGQYYPGKPKYPDGELDGYKSRERYFNAALNKILSINELISVALPYRIGCNMAGGNWDNYLQMIKEFSEKTHAKVSIYNLI